VTTTRRPTTTQTHGGIGTTALDDAWHFAGRKGPFTGQTWGDFALGGMLGEGGMGAVYRAMQLSLHRRVALKVLAPRMAQDARMLERFMLEATTASRLQSPHVVQVYAIGEEDGSHYYAMEYVEGTDLGELARQRKADQHPLTPDEAAGYILQAAKGLAEAGRLGIVHRDIKPPNLMVTRNDLLKIADFGIVKVLGEHNLTLTGQAIGTPAYLSPEQGRGDRDLDCRSDIYSLGVVFYELACGKKPFIGVNANALIYQHCFEEPPLPKSVNLTISDEHQAVILRCLQKDPAERYQSADELVKDLDSIRTGAMLKSVLASYRLVTGADAARKAQMSWLQRNLLPVAAAAALVIGAIVAIGWYRYAQSQRQEIASVRYKMVGVHEIADQRSRLAAAFDAVKPLPEDAGTQLDKFAKLAPEGKGDSDLRRWREKLSAITDLESRLSLLQKMVIAPELRRIGRANYDAFIAKVGADAPAAVRAKTRLDALDADEKRLRNACAPLDAMALKLDDRKRFGDLLKSLAALVPSDDPQLAKWQGKLAAFDAELGALRARIEPLDQEKQVTAAKRTQYLPVLTDLSVYLDPTDPDLRRWTEKLKGADERLARLRADIKAVVGAQPETIPKPKQEQIANKLADLQAALAGVEDPQMKDWQAAIASTERALATARKSIVTRIQESGDGVLPQPAQPAVERDLKLLADLGAVDDADRLKGEQILRDSRRTLDGLRADCAVLAATATATVSLAAQRDLEAKVQRLAAKGAVEAERLDAWRNRLAVEAKRVADLRASLVSFDAVTSITPAMLAGLDSLLRDAGADDPDVQRWVAKRDRVVALQDALGALDRRTGIPEEVEQRLAELAALVGEKDPQLLAWRGKTTRLVAVKATLAVLDQRAPFDAVTISAGLTELATLAGDQDRQYRSWKAKAARVTALKADLASLATAIALSADAHAAAHDRLRQLVAELVGPDDPQAQAAAARLAELDGPPKPSWARDLGRDAHGLWAQAALPGGNLRLRWLASGTFIIGSPDIEPGHEADELQVKLTLPKGFWIAEVETPRAIWTAVMGHDPSRSPLSDAAVQPVERMTWGEAVAFGQALAEAVPGFAARLPLEAEWEYACRAGSAAPWCLPPGVKADAEGVGKLAWYNGNTNEDAQPSCNRLPNPLGLYDMHGNLAEWCADAYMPYPTAPITVTAPASGSDRRVLRGASWGDSWLKTRAANRIPMRPDARSAFIGCRLVVDANWGNAKPDGKALLALHTAAAPVAGTEPHLYRVAGDDTVASIAQTHYGDREAWRLIAAANPWLDPAKPLTVGTWLTLPPSGWRAYAAVDGDTLATIAKRQLGDRAPWQAIATANPWLDAAKPITTGRWLLLPPTPAPVAPTVAPRPATGASGVKQ
jgi:formylglycine-generating enzyme required for sulfatase activity/tRNA A-37 threonylcarbamoyl transferase component Bud32